MWTDLDDGFRAMDNVPCGIVVFDDDGIVLRLNRMLANWLCVERAELEGKSLDALFPPGGRIFLQTHFLPLLHGDGAVREVYFALRTSAGEDLPVLLNAERTQADEGTVVNVAAFISISNRNQFEDALLRSLHAQQEAGEQLAARNSELLRIEASLNRANAIKDEFLGLVSHELRTPLSIISGAVSLLRRRMDSLDEATRAELLADLESESARLLSLVGDMLIVARANLDQAVELEPVLIQRLLPPLVERGVAGLDPARIALKIDPGVPPVMANAGFVEQIVSNFLTNAAKYGGPGGEVALSVSASADGYLRVTVGNAGHELDEDRVAQFFQPFFRGEEGKGEGGLGLGLSVCQRLAEAQGGTVSARPRPGGGLEISLSLPVVAE